MSDDGRRRAGAVLALAAGVDALLIGHDLGEEAVEAVQRALVDAVAAASSRGAAARGGRSRGPRRRVGGVAPVPAGRSTARRAQTARGRRSGRRRRRRSTGCAARRRAAPAGEHRRRRGRAFARRGARRAAAGDARRSCSTRRRAHPAAAERWPARGRSWSSSATPIVTRGCASSPSGLPASIVVEIGLPLWRPARRARLRRHATAAAASATRCWPTACSSASAVTGVSRRPGSSRSCASSPRRWRGCSTRRRRTREASSARSSGGATCATS